MSGCMFSRTSSPPIVGACPALLLISLLESFAVLCGSRVHGNLIDGVATALAAYLVPDLPRRISLFCFMSFIVFGLSYLPGIVAECKA